MGLGRGWGEFMVCGLLGGGLDLMVGAGFVQDWFGGWLGYGLWEVGTVWVKAGWFVFRHLGCCFS